MNLSGHESRRLQEMEQRLAAEDPDLASLLSTGLGEPGPPAPFAARMAPHGPPASTSGTTKTMLIALACLVALIFGAHLLSPDGLPADKREQPSPQSPQCHNVSMRDPDCRELRRYTPTG